MVNYRRLRVLSFVLCLNVVNSEKCDFDTLLTLVRLRTYVTFASI